MKLFNIIVGISALFVAGCSAFFSVRGIGMLFSGALLSVVIMAASLEIGKIVATSFLYRYWKNTTAFLKTYLCIAIFVLMGITSLGVFGFLSAAYQKSSSEFGIYNQQIQMVESQKAQVVSQVESTKKKIESLGKLREQQEERLSKNGLDNNANRRASDIKKVQDNIMELSRQTTEDDKKAQASLEKLLSKLQDFDNKILTLKTTSQKSKDMLAFQFIADAFGMNLNTVVKWFIMTIIVVFDPLAICLILAYNVALFSDKNVPLKEVVEPELKKKVE